MHCSYYFPITRSVHFGVMDFPGWDWTAIALDGDGESEDPSKSFVVSRSVS